MARSSDLAPGTIVRVRRGYSVRPAIVERVYGGRVHVRFTDVSDADLRSIPAANRGGLLGAAVRPGAITSA